MTMDSPLTLALALPGSSLDLSPTMHALSPSPSPSPVPMLTVSETAPAPAMSPSAPPPPHLPFALIKPDIHLHVFPLAENITMFGSTQTTSNYSISGKCVLTIAPNPRLPQPQSAMLTVAHQHQHRTRSPSPLVPAIDQQDVPISPRPDTTVDSTSTTSTTTTTTPRPLLPTDDSQPIPETETDSEQPTLRVTSLQAAFRGYALYMDHTARFSALKLAEVEQECLPNGALLPFPVSSLPPGPGRKQTSRYEIDFDLSVPGWLPASLRSRFGGNFYCVSAVATLSDGRVLRAEEPTQQEILQQVLSSSTRDGVTSGRQTPHSPMLAGSRSLDTGTGTDGLPHDRTPDYVETAPPSGTAPPIEGLPFPPSSTLSLSPYAPGNTTPTSLRERAAFPLPLPPGLSSSSSTTLIPGGSTPRLPTARPASYAPGSQHTLDYERALPAVGDDHAPGGGGGGGRSAGSAGPRRMPVSASLGVLDVGGAGPRHSTSSVPSPPANFNNFLRAEEANRRAAPAPPAAPAPAVGPSSSSSGLFRLKSFRQGRHSAAAAAAAAAAASASAATSPDLSRPTHLREGDGFDQPAEAGPSSSAGRNDSSRPPPPLPLSLPASPSLGALEQKKKASKPRSSWLGKRAKQLSLNTSRSGSSSAGGSESPTVASASAGGGGSSLLPTSTSASGSGSGSGSRMSARSGAGAGATEGIGIGINADSSSSRDDPTRRAWRPSERSGTSGRPSFSDPASASASGFRAGAGANGGGGGSLASEVLAQRDRDRDRDSGGGRPSLTVRTSRRAAAASASASASTEAGGGEGSSRFVQEQSDGSLRVKSEPKVIIIRRCRDVVPVSMARVAQPGVDGLSMPVVDGAVTTAAAAAATQPQTGPQAGALPRREVPARLGSNEVLANTSSSSSTSTTRAAIIDESEGATHNTGQESAVLLTDDVLADAEEGMDVHPLERRERERAEMLEDEGMGMGDEDVGVGVAEVSPSGVDAPVSTATATPALAPDGQGQGPDAAPTGHSHSHRIPTMLPPAPSPWNVPTDPHKLAAMASAARNAASNGMRSGGSRRNGPSGSGAGGSGAAGAAGGRGGMTTSSHSNQTAPNGAPMRHFLHRPVLHAPAESNIEGDGLPFALTLSLPSHVHVEGATSDVLTFGLQIEVGRSSGWSRVRELGGLRLRDMELVCLQTERHSSAASRTFCNAFTLPPDPQLAPEDVPKLPDPLGSTRKPYPPSEHRLRQGYDREVLENHIRMVQTGNVPNSRENNVERSRTTIVGPPPLAPRGGGSSAGNSHDKEPEGKDRKGKKVSRGGGGSGGGGGGASGDGGQPKSKKESRKSVVLPNLPDPHDLSTGARTGNGEGSSSSRDISASGGGSSIPRGGESSSAATTAPSTPTTTSKPFSRGRRGIANAMNRLSHFASAMLDGGNDSDHGGDSGDANYGRGGGGNADRSTGGGGGGGNGHRRDKDKDKDGGSGGGGGADQPRATYSFSGEDGNGVDLTKGRVRMTINLPLVPSNGERAREMGAVQLIPDYESPYVRIRHKLKVKLGFGFGGAPLGGEGWWGQALVMCVPVRFTDSPPAEVQPAAIAAAPQPSAEGASASSGPTATIDPIIETITSSVPVLPAYTQLFREDGSRLGDEAEDLPQYPGRPEGATPGDGTAEGGSTNHTRRPSLLRLQRGSITGPQPATDDPTSNRILPSQVVDEAAPNNGTDAQAQEAAARELAEMSDVGEVADDDDDDDDGIDSESEHGGDTTEDVDVDGDGEEENVADGDGETDADGNDTVHGEEETVASEDVVDQDTAGDEDEEEEESSREREPTAIPNSSADADEEAFLESVKGKEVAHHADILHDTDTADEGIVTDHDHDGDTEADSKAASSPTPEQFHGKESRWALTGLGEDLRPHGVGSPEV